MKAEYGVWKCWLSCRNFTIQTNVDEHGMIVWTAPIARRFLGQPLGNLVEFMRKIGGFGFLGRLELREHFLRGLTFTPEEKRQQRINEIHTLLKLGFEQDEWGRFIRPAS